MTRCVPHVCLAFTLLTPTGCALSLGSSGGAPDFRSSFTTETFNIESSGIGSSQTEAERDAWHEAAYRLRAMGYTEFRLNQASLSGSGGGPDQIEVKVSYKVSDARRGGGGCACDLKQSGHRVEEH